MSLHDLDRPDDSAERLVVLREAIARSDAKRVEEVSVGEQHREDRDAFLLAGGVRAVRQRGMEPLPAADRHPIVRGRTTEIRVAGREGGYELVGRGLQIVRLVAGDADLDAVREI